MALTAIVTKKSVVFVQPKLHSITFNLVLNDGAIPVLDRDISCQFAAGDTVAAKVAFVVELMQTEIDRYKAVQVIFNSAALATAVTSISNALVV